MAVSHVGQVAGCWELLPQMTSPRHGCSACATNGVLYVLGGADVPWLPWFHGPWNGSLNGRKNHEVMGFSWDKKP